MPSWYPAGPTPEYVDVEMPVRLDRHFRLFWYTTAHSNVVLHADPTEIDRRIVDLRFHAVHDLKLSNKTGKLTVRRPNGDELAHIVKEIGRAIEDGESVFFLDSADGRHGYVIASSVTMASYGVEEANAGVSLLADLFGHGQFPRQIFQLVDAAS